LEVTEQTLTKISIKWTHTDADTFNVYRDGILIAENLEALTYTDEGTFVAGKIYQYCVIPVYATCQVAPVCVEAYIEPCVPEDVTNVVLVGDWQKKEIVVTWTYTGTATFNVLRNGKFIANVSTKTYTDTEVEYDVVYKYCIVPVSDCPGGGTACNTTVITAIDEATMGLGIYPNPASAQVTIEGKVVTQVDIYNAIGQMIETIKNTDSETTFKVDVSSYEPGTYIFKVHTDDSNVITKPIVVTRN
jgi:hypothetical protein